MIGYVMVGTVDLDRSAKFYAAVLAPLGLNEVERTDSYIGYAETSELGEIEFYVTLPFNQKTATSGNGTMVAIKAPSVQAVNSFHEIAIKNGGIDEGAPRLRLEESNVYYAYMRDLDGNKICAYCSHKILQEKDEKPTIPRS